MSHMSNSGNDTNNSNSNSATNANTLKSLLQNELSTRHSLNPTDGWLTTFLTTTTTSHSRPPPLPALTSTATFRLTQTDIRTTLRPQPPYIFPPNIADVNVKQAVLAADVPVQVLEVRDLGTSRYSQVEAIERVERGEEVRGREVIRSVPGLSDDSGDMDGGDLNGGRQAQAQTQTQTQRGTTRGSGNSSTTTGYGNSGNSNNSAKKGSTGPHKLLLQDAAGTKTWGFELTRIEKITIVNTGPTNGPGVTVPTQVEGIQIGCKLILRRGTNVRRGLVMLSAGSTVFMGGKVEEWDRAWREARKGVLRGELEGNVGEG